MDVAALIAEYGTTLAILTVVWLLWRIDRNTAATNDYLAADYADDTTTGDDDTNT